MLWVLKRIVSSSFEHPKHMLKNMGKNNIYNFTLKIYVNLNLCSIKAGTFVGIFNGSASQDPMNSQAY